MEHNLHATGDQLEQYALGRLPDSDLLAFEEHLIVCANCRERLDGWEDFAIGMRVALDQEPESIRVAARRIDWLGWLRRPVFSMAVAFAVLIIAAGILSRGRTKFVPSATLQLTAIRGEMPLTVPAREFDLTLSDSPGGAGQFRIELVNSLGKPMWKGLAASSPAGAQIKVTRPLKEGDYFIRLYDATGNVTREYGFRIRS